MSGSPRVLVLALAAFVVAGCLDVAVPSAEPTPTRAPEPTAVVTTFRLDTTVWYAGLVLTFKEAVATLDQRGGSVIVDVTFENTGTEIATLGGPIRLVIGADAFEPTRETVLPEVLPGTTTTASIEFDVVGHRSAGSGTIVIGRETEHQPRVPLGQDGAEAAPFEPVVLELSGNATAGQLRLRLRSAELRWDLPDWGEQLPSSSASLTVTYDAAYVGNFAGGFPFTGENVALRLPDGTWVRARADGRSQSIELIGARKNKRDLRTRFEIPAGVRGEVDLIVIDGGARRYLTFSLPG